MRLPIVASDDDLMPGSRCRDKPGTVYTDTAGTETYLRQCYIFTIMQPDRFSGAFKMTLGNVGGSFESAVRKLHGTLCMFCSLDNLIHLLHCNFSSEVCT